MKKLPLIFFIECDYIRIMSSFAVNVFTHKRTFLIFFIELDRGTSVKPVNQSLFHTSAI